MYIASILASLFLFSAISVGLYRRFAFKHNLLDIPNARSSHSQPTPRGGGFVFVVLWVVVCIIEAILNPAWRPDAFAIIPGAILIGAIGFWDDRGHVPSGYRLIVHFIAASLALYFLGGFPSLLIGKFQLPLSFVGTILAVIALVWSTNLYNFMDGIDGLAGIEAVFTLLIGGVIFAIHGAWVLADVTWALASLVLGFLVWNWPGAKIFMGDCGSGFLGYAILVLGFSGERLHQIPTILWVMLYGIFIFDATVTLLRRVYAGEKWYIPHRLHAFQRLYRLGWSNKKILYAVILVNSIIAVLAIIGAYFPVFVPELALLELVGLTVIYLKIEQRLPMFTGKE